MKQKLILIVLIVLSGNLMGADVSNMKLVTRYYPEGLDQNLMPKVAKQSVNSSKFENLLLSLNLRNRWDKVIANATSKTELLKFNSCLTNVTSTELGEYRDRLKFLLSSRLSRADFRFLSAVNVEKREFGPERRAFASTALRMGGFGCCCCG